MKTKLAEIELLLARIERLAAELHVDPDGHVRRSAVELRAAFETRAAVEPLVWRVRESIEMLQRTNEDGTRREFRQRAHAVGYLEDVMRAELVPMLRQVGFDV